MEHATLFLTRGLRPAIGDTDSAEGIKQRINLLVAKSGKTDWSLTDWQPGIPQAKGGLWNDAPQGAGRQLLGQGVQNVIETMQILLTATDQRQMARQLKAMNKFIYHARAFHTTEWELEPSYIHWKVKGGYGDQYALIYAMDIAAINPNVSETTPYMVDVTLTIEREPFWRPIPPGANPVIWTRAVNGDHEGKDYTYKAHTSPSDATTNSGYSLNTQSGAANDTLDNRWESDDSTWDTFNSHNYIVIPAEKIPGDAPALLTILIDQTDASISETYPFMVWKSTNRLFRAISSDNYYQFCWLSALNISSLSQPPIGANTTVAYADDTGGVEGYRVPAGHTATKQRLEIDPHTSFQLALNWNQPYRAELHRGRYAVIGRLRQDSQSAGDAEFYLTYQSAGGIRLQTDTYPVPLQASTGNTTEWPLTYMGTIDLPPGPSPTIIQTAGGGEQHSANNDLQFQLYMKCSSAALVYFCDIALIKIDEGAIDLIPGVNALLATSAELIWWDNTGYFMHGKPGQYARSQDDSSVDQVNPVEIRGSDLQLTPGVDNILFFMRRDQDGNSSALAQFQVKVHVLPRWMGARDA